MGYCEKHKLRLPEGCECPSCALEDTHCLHSPSKSDGKCKKCGKVLYVHRKGCPAGGKEENTGRCGGAGVGADAAADAILNRPPLDILLNSTPGGGYAPTLPIEGDEDLIKKLAKLQSVYKPGPTRIDKVREKVLARPPEGRDLITSPPHYMVLPDKGVESKHIIEAVLNTGEPVEAFDNSCLGKSIEYLLRCKKKGNMRMDLRKAKEYINIILGE